MAKTLELIFDGQRGAVKVSVKNPKEPIDPTAIKAAMDEIVLANVFVAANGRIVSPKNARVIDRTTQEIELP
jgi:hypothetical protein